jgi:alkanesulfonate monooxygenase SsuD/methylene tetrahydromethanopterin reductase-like flavin-dependent oxidoreductase (luciferase family)
MKFGFIPTEGGHFFQESLAEVICGEKLGFDSVWLEEHHSVKDHYWPSPLLGLAAYAARTEHILLGTDIVVLSFYHPVRLAEDAAMLDVISRGRFILGTAIGYRPAEFALYDVAMEKRGSRYAEALCLMKKLWREDAVTFEGQYYRVSDGCIEPKPYGSMVPLWLGGWGKLSLKRAAELGDAWVPGPTAGLEKLLEAQAVYKENLTIAGKDPAALPTPLTREVIIADTGQQARELAERHMLVNYRDEYGGGWSHPLIGNEDTTGVGQIDTLGKDRFIIGNPDECIQKIQSFQTAFGVDHLICRLYFPGMPHRHILHELELISKEVMPAFKD